MKRILMDQGLPPRAGNILRERGWDAVHTRDVGLRQAPDEEILARAYAEGRVVVTLDRDFPQLLALSGASLPSIVLIRQERLRAPALAELLMSVWGEHEDALDKGIIISVAARAIRLRPLPLGER
jgi:predicted nuclease of predicted toxin-antitoxin system